MVAFPPSASADPSLKGNLRRPVPGDNRDIDRRATLVGRISRERQTRNYLVGRTDTRVPWTWASILASLGRYNMSTCRAHFVLHNL